MLGTIAAGRIAWLYGGLLAGFALQAGAQGIFTCVDAKGRRLTSDRPIPECNDRVQKELNPTGTVKRHIQPPPTAAELAAQEAQAKKEAEERQQQAEQRKKERAMLSRYPNRAAHDKERHATLVAVDESIKAADARTLSLIAQRKKLDAETEFYKSDPSKIPLVLKRQIEENDQQMGAQKRYVADREEEKKRIQQRFDAELTQLQKLWNPAPAAR